MATKTGTTRARIERTKTELRSTSTCTATTVSDLHCLLAEKPEEPVQKENVRVKSSQLLSVQSTARRKGVSATTTTTVDVVTQTTASLAPREKYILATEVANITLKSLADALKSQPSPQLPRTDSKPKSLTNHETRTPAKQRTAHSKNQSTSQRPLQERSVSQVMNSPRKPSSLRRSSSYSSFLTTGPDSGLLATAECAQMAFSYLRTQEAVKTAGKDSPALQLENGILALIGKLVAHGLDHLAVKELRVLKKRLDQFPGASVNNASQEGRRAIGRAESRKPPVSTEKESLASLLDFGDVDLKSPALPIITSHQIYTLRVIARIRRPRTVEAAWEYLKLSSPSSPANLIWHTAKTPAFQAKATRQLESLAQTVLSLCPSISSSDDITTGEDHLQPSPDIVFLLQHLAFKIRQRWWSLAKHEGNKEKELLEPFSKCLVAFSRRSRLSAAKKYKTAESLYVDLCGSVDESTSSPKNGSLSIAQVAKSLSSLAQAAGLTDEALRWLGVSGSPSTSKNSAARMATRLVRITTLSLEATLKQPPKPDLEATITETLNALSGSLGGSASELDSLFMEVNALRRMATKILWTASSTTEGSPRSSPIQHQAIRIIAASIHFTARFIGPKRPDDVDTKDQSRYNERVIMASKFLKSIVDSAMICCKQPMDSDIRWTDLDSLIQDCACILQHFEQHLEKDTAHTPKFPEDPQNPYIKISNAYWAVHLQLRRANGNPDLIVMAMQRSADFLQSRSQAERQSGLLGMKLEKLGEALDYIDRGESSRDAFSRCIQFFVDSGVLQEMVELAAKYPIQQVFESSGSITTLGRVLKSYHRSFLKYGRKDSDDLAFYDSSDLSFAARGALLEWQLALYLKSLSRNRPWDPALNSSIQAIVKRLLELYVPTEFPVRRQRVRLRLFQLSQEHPDILHQAISQVDNELDSKVTEVQTQDQELVRYESHLRTLLKLKLSMREAAPSMVIFRECLSVWQSLVDTASSWNDIIGRVDDPEDWIQEMQAIADYLAAKGEEYICLPVLHLQVTVLELENSSEPSRLVTSLCALGLQFLRLGYSGKAGLAFVKAETLISNRAISTEARLQWHVGYAEYLLKIGNTAKCEGILSTAQVVATEDAQFMSLAKSSTTLSGRVRFNRILAEACYVHSLLSMSNGYYRDASRFAKQCVALNRRVWAALETKCSSRRTAQTESMDLEGEGPKGDFDPLSSMRNDKGIPLVMSVTHNSLDGAEFWSLVPALYRGLMQHSLVFAHQGLFPEAMFVAEQAEKVASATNSRSLIVENCSHRAELWAQSGRPDKAQPILEAVEHSASYKHLAMVGYHSSTARVFHSSGKFDEELAAYDMMESLLNGLTLPSYIGTLDSFSPDVDSLTEQISAISLVSCGPKGKNTVKSTRGRKPAPKAAPRTTPRTTPRTAPRTATKAASKAVPKTTRKVTQPMAPQTSSILEECSSLYGLQADTTRRKALANLLQDNVSKAFELLDQAESLEKGLGRNVEHLWASFKTMFSQSMKELAEDFNFNSLPESTIAFPAIGQKDRRSSDAAVAKRTTIAPSTTSKGTRSKKCTKETFMATLCEARERLVEAHALCSDTGSNHSFQQASFALSQVTVLLSAISSVDMRGSLHPLYAAYMGEIPKSNSLRLAQESVEVEQESMSREECLKWPDSNPSQRLALAPTTDFQKHYVDIIPESWTAVSLALNEEHDELYITRYETGHSPFVLRLPMARHTSRDVDEEEFTFNDGKRDFDEIIELSDFSTRTAKDMTSREARLQWWTEREALDTRLHALLLNMENIWLGGFKGIFSQHPRQPSLLARFRKSFDNILNRHLPSRRGKKQPKTPILDARVLELFVGVGDATSEELDLDEALMDLIYFVVDILQFNGERNAYDEIDFDAMVIETLDALRAYHDVSQSISANTTHTILILDKNLHAFPWESMPCLQSLSISRLPSLAALRERILAARSPEAVLDARPGHYISAESGGTSILNPSGDLTHTLKTLKPRLDDMQGSWTHIANRGPTENEFESSLKDQDLVLYFGHGSGAQFVRSKSVRRLYPGNQAEHEKKPGCATTLLFGCSSVHLSENGIYEPSGMLASYLIAGAPAVVGMLWDVTDKDCDRFAVKAGELWGLWPETQGEVEDAPKTTKKSKGKGKAAQLVAEVESARGTGIGRRGRRDRGQMGDDMDAEGSAVKERRRGVGLDEAVREARGACVLRYLNGAAAVVYGIPVYLE